MEETRRTDIHELLLDRYGPKGEALYMLVGGLLTIPVNGFAAYLSGLLLLFPSLSPTVFALFRQPLTEQGSPCNTTIGHFVAVAVGLGFLYVFGLADESSVLERTITLPRIGAAAASVAVTEVLLVLIRRPHPGGHHDAPGEPWHLHHSVRAGLPAGRHRARHRRRLYCQPRLRRAGACLGTQRARGLVRPGLIKSRDGGGRCGDHDRLSRGLRSQQAGVGGARVHAARNIGARSADLPKGKL